jgi:hypothetical protein
VVAEENSDEHSYSMVASDDATENLVFGVIVAMMMFP